MQTAVVIPFFQRQPGILPQAVRSVLEQRDVPPPSIIIVDDSSPITAESEIAGFDAATRARIRVFRQPNGGPGAARNRGLDEVPPGTEAIAFLDSDDQWRPTHLSRAFRALGSGFDLYFANFYDIGETEGSFSRLKLMDPAQHRPLGAVEDTFAYQGDIRTQILGRCPVETSTVVYRREPLEHLRFRADFRDAYEDLLFWFDIVSKTQRIVFSTQVECEYGLGVNIYRGGVWGTDASLKRIVGSTRFKSYLRRHAALTQDQLATIDSGLQRNRRALATEIVHRVRHLKPMLWRHLWLHVKADPRAAVSLLPETARLILQRTSTR